MGLTGHVARMGENISAFKVSVRKPEVKGSLGRPGRSSENTVPI
jgi:hypothetical protein